MVRLSPGSLCLALVLRHDMLISSPADYGECHYIAPVRGAQPNSQAWVDGFPHEPWMALTAYFARAFREGRHPPVEKDQIFMWARPHPKDAEARDDNVPKPDNWELVSFALIIYL